MARKPSYEELVKRVKELEKECLERKRVKEALWDSQSRYQTLFEDSMDAIAITTPDGKFLDVNQSALNLFGYTREEVMSMNFRRLYIDPGDGHRFQQEIEKKGSVRDYEVRLRRKDDTEIDCLFTVTAKRSDDGSLLGYQGIIRDLTDHKRIEEELLRAKKHESIGVLANGISHDFNNLLTGILGNIDLARDDLHPGEEAYRRLNDAEEGCMRAKDLTHEFLAFSRNVAPMRKLGSLEKLVRVSATLALAGSSVRYESSIPDDLWLVEFDEEQMKQVLNNLMTNAKEAMPEGGTVNVHAENVMIEEDGKKPGVPIKKGPYVKLSIQDQGIGIPEENLSKIFDPYFSTKKAWTQKGMGLGLATAYSYVKKHDGHLCVDSKCGVGTTCYVYLPASKRGIKKMEEINKRSMFGKGRILLMDDEEMVRDVAGQMLNRIGYEVELAEEGTVAVELYKKAKESGRPFDAVILDLTVRGGVGGKEVMKELFEIDPSVKGIVSSGYINDPVMAEFKTYGFCGAAAKPYKIDELGSALNEALKGEKA